MNSHVTMSPIPHSTCKACKVETDWDGDDRKEHDLEFHFLRIGGDGVVIMIDWKEYRYCSKMSGALRLNSACLSISGIVLVLMKNRPRMFNILAVTSWP